MEAFFILDVTPEGLEPPTDRTGICYSIQLNYGAMGSAKLAIFSFVVILFQECIITFHKMLFLVF